MYIRFGNLTVEQFAERVGAEFTADEIALLESHRSAIADFTDPDKFHIFDNPAITVLIGSKAMAATVAIWSAVNARKEFNQEVNFYPIKEAA